MAYRERWYNYLESSRDRFRGTFRKYLDQRLNEFLQGQAKPATKDCVKRIVEESAEHIIKLEMESLKEAFDELENLEGKLEEYKAIKSEFDGLEDDRAKTALLIYNKTCKSEKGDDNYAKCRRITAAGLMAAAYLGLKGYEVSNHSEQKLIK